MKKPTPKLSPAIGENRPMDAGCDGPSQPGYAAPRLCG